MHQNQSGLYANNLSSHASLLLSATPTIITSPLQNNTNNSRSSPIPTPETPIQRRQPSIPLLATASNLDNDISLNDDNIPLNTTISEGYINFKKPQNEMFKKLDGKIQKIVAAHSNLNKLYALNDFSSLGAGPKRPFELPPQLPPPPPWVPKGAVEYGSQWTGSDSTNLVTIVPQSLPQPQPPSIDTTDCRSSPTMFNPKRLLKPNTTNRNSPSALYSNKPSSSAITIDSAISKLHQRRQQQLSQRSNLNLNQDTPSPRPSSSTSANHQNVPTITPAQFSLLAQKIKETIETECPSKNSDGNPCDVDKKKFQEDLINLLKEEITAVTKSAKLRFNSPVHEKPKNNEQRWLIMKSSPQTLFNTIRRETSLLLNKRDSGRSSLSLLTDQQTFNRSNTHENQARQPLNKLHTIKVIIPPTEYNQIAKPGEKDSENMIREPEHSASSVTNPLLTYQVIKKKIQLFQEKNQIFLGKPVKNQWPVSNLAKSNAGKRSLDKIVDRLQAKCTPSPTEPDISIGAQRDTSLQQQILSSSASLLQTSRCPPMSAPTPIPVFRLPSTAKGVYFYAGSTGGSKLVNLKVKKSKRLHYFGLKIGNYLDSSHPQPSTERMTIDQFAKCLNLVGSNDASLQKHQEQLLQSESKWRTPISNRPLRLRRLRGERIHMPASASYRATRKVGLQ